MALKKHGRASAHNIFWVLSVCLCIPMFPFARLLSFVDYPEKNVRGTELREHICLKYSILSVKAKKKT